MVWKEPGKDKDPWNTTERPPDLERWVKNLQQRLGKLFGGKRVGRPHQFHAATLWWLVPIIIAAWLASGFYTVAPGDRGVQFIFGRYHGTSQPGLHWRTPWPIGRVDIVSGVEGRDYAHTYNNLLTSDGSLVVVDATVHYHVADLRDYLFNTATPSSAPEEAGSGSKVLLGQLANAAIRAAVARSTFASIMGSGWDAIEADARRQLNGALQPYHAGIEVTQLQFQRVSLPQAVASSDGDVQGAEQQAGQAENAARAYADNLLPQAQTEADAKLKQAQAYRTTLVGQAQADTARFDMVLAAYRKAPAVTREELYTQTMEEILANADKVVVDTRGGNVTVQLGQPFAPPVESRVAPAKAAVKAAASATTGTSAPAATTKGGA